MVADYRPTHHLGPRVLSDAQQLYGTVTPSFMLFLSILSQSVSSATLQPFTLCVCSPRGIPLSFCISLSPSVSMHPVSFSSCSLLRRLSLPNPRFIYSPLVYFLSHMCVFLSCCSGLTDSTSLTTRARAALSSSSRPKSWKRSGWSSLAWPCECVLSFCAFICDIVIRVFVCFH